MASRSLLFVCVVAAAAARHHARVGQRVTIRSADCPLDETARSGNEHELRAEQERWLARDPELRRRLGSGRIVVGTGIEIRPSRDG